MVYLPANWRMTDDDEKAAREGNPFKVTRGHGYWTISHNGDWVRRPRGGIRRFKHLKRACIAADTLQREILERAIARSGKQG